MVCASSAVVEAAKRAEPVKSVNTATDPIAVRESIGQRKECACTLEYLFLYFFVWLTACNCFCSFFFGCREKGV